MFRRLPAVLMVIALAIVFAVPALAPPARASLEVPTWHVGDYWEYELTGTASPTPGAIMRARYDVVGTESITVSGISYPSYHARLTFNMTAGGTSITFPGDEWFRTSDLSAVKTTFTATFGGSSFTITVTYNPPIEIRWPLTASAQWSSTSLVTNVIEFTGQPPSTTNATLAETLRVDADESQTVPAGTFTVTPLVQTEAAGGSYQKGYWSRSAGNVVEQKAYDSNDAETGGMELTSYRHAAPGEGTGIFGLPTVAWALILLVVLVGVIAAVVMRRRRPMAPAGYPPVGPPTPWQPPGAPPPPGPGTPPMEPGGPAAPPP